jgi:hypothetical protein
MKLALQIRMQQPSLILLNQPHLASYQHCINAHLAAVKSLSI